MREDRIKQGVEFLNSIDNKKISLQEQKQFLQSKMTEEEIAEVFKRAKNENQNPDPIAIERLKQVDGHFIQNQGSAQMQQVQQHSLVTVASTAIISSLALTYLLDKYKNKSDKNLREEIKDRLNSTVQDQRKLIDDLNLSQKSIQNQIITQQTIENIIDSKLKAFQEKMIVQETTQKALNLKLRGNQNKNHSIFGNNSRGSGAQWESAEDEFTENKAKKNLNDYQNNLELIREFRDMKISVQESVKEIQYQSLQISQTLKETLFEIKKLNERIPLLTNSESLDNFQAQEIQEFKKEDLSLALNEQILSKEEILEKERIQIQIEQEKEQNEHPCLNEEQKGILKSNYEHFISQFKANQDKDYAIKQLKLVFNLINNKNCQENFKTIQMSNEKFKKIKDSNEYFSEFLEKSGFQKLAGTSLDVKYKFILEKDNQPNVQPVEPNQIIENIDGDQEKDQSEIENQKEIIPNIKKGNRKNLEYILSLM